MTQDDTFLGGTVTILLGDVEGSTRLWESDGGRAYAAIARLDALADKLVASHDGIRPLEQGEGDNVVAVFAKATDAVACALALQRELQHEDDHPLPLRIALHAGEVEVRPDGKYGGATFNRCARLRSLASGGQTLLSRPVYDLTVDDLPQNATLRDLGVHELRDLARPEHVFQLDHPDLASEFPSLPSAEVPNNLPAELTTFIGRDAELEELTALLERNRLVTLTGAGGCGKTRLALRMAGVLLDRFPAGVWWIDLAPISDQNLVPVRLASLLSVRGNEDESLIDTLAHKLAGSRVLLVMDNCEHLVASSSRFASQLLRGSDALTILATSREPLGVEGELSFRVPSLAVPDGDLTAEAAQAFDAVRLFADRASRVRSNFSVTSENVGAIVEICRGLDGIPLAIELAAARMRALNAQRIASRLGDRFRLLTGGDNAMLPRQRTLEASVEWSFGMLGDRERLLLMRASVFAGTFDLEAAEAVCAGGAIELREVLDLLSNLVDRSLVQFEDTGAEPRYSLLETIRVFARQRLFEAGELEDLRRRHLEHYLSVAEQRDEADRAAVEEFMGELETEMNNLRAAMDWAQSSGEIEKGLRIATETWPMSWIRGNWNEVLRRLEIAVDATAVDTYVRAKALIGAATLCLYAGRMRDLRRFAALAGELFGEIGKERWRGRALSFLSFGEGLVHEKGREHAEEAIAIAAETGDAVPLMALGALGFHAAYTARWDDAAELFARAEDAAREGVNGVGLYTARFWYASFVSLERGLITEAVERFEELLDSARARENASPIAFALMYLSRSLVYAGEYERARSLALEGIEVGRESGTLQGWIESLASLALVEYALGELAEAAEHLERCVRSAYTTEFPEHLPEALHWLVCVRLAAEDVDGACRYMERTVESSHLFVRLRDARMRITSARLARAEGDHSSADDLAHEGLALAARYGVYVETVDGLETVAGLAAHFESYEEASRLFGAAQRLREEIGYIRFPVERAAYESDVELARSGLGAEGFEKAWAEGVSMFLEEAVSYAERGRGERKRPSAGWGSLTPTEIEVVRLAAQGLTNPQIAERLFIARNTVKVHLSHVFAKLGVATRAELAAEATRRAI